MIVRRGNFQKVVAELCIPGNRSLDTETTGLRAYHDDRIFSIIIGDAEKNYYFNFQPYDELAEEWVLPREDMTSLAVVFQEPASKWYMSDAKFDLAMLAREGLRIAGEIHCTVALGRIESNDELKYGLDACAKRIGLEKSDAVKAHITDHHLWEWMTIPGKKKRVKKMYFDRVPFSIMQPYGEQDAKVTRQVATHQEEFFHETVLSTAEGLPPIDQVVQNEKRFTKTCFNVERTGIRIDTEYCQRAIVYEEGRYAEAAALFQDLTGIPFQDANSILEQAFRRAGEEIPLTALGNSSFTDEILQGYTSPVARVVQTYRDAYKKANTYYKNFLYFVDKNGRIHSNIKQGGTGTGRISVTDPALQTLPDEEGLDLEFKVRRAFIPDPDKIFVMLDYDQMEYRVMLDYSGQMDIIEQVQGGMDVHDATAKIINEMLGMAITRSQAKTLNFGLLYGMGIDALAQALRTPKENASELKKAYFQALPQVQRLIRRVTKRAESQGYIFNWFGRRSYFKDPKFCYKACNYLIQGGCGDVVKVAMNQIDELLAGTDTRMVMQVHDELLFEMPVSDLPLVSQIKNIMEDAYPHRHLRLTCSVEHGLQSWGDKIKGTPNF